MNKEKENKELEPKYKLGDLVVIKSYPETFPLNGDPLHIPPIMIVVGVEIENKKKKTHDNELGKQVADRVKYILTWFDNKKSDFVEKILYESFLEFYSEKHKEKEIPELNFKYEYGGISFLRTTPLELIKTKNSKNINNTKFISGGQKDNEKEINSKTSLVTFSCPELVVTGIKKNDKKNSFDDFGNQTKFYSENLIKVMWFNPNLQKYTEQELAQECLNNI